jgi:hypothetical protein
MVALSSDTLLSFNSALNKLTGASRRQYAAELCGRYFSNSARKMERYLNVSRSMVELGQHEQRTGIECLDAYNLRGAKKKNKAIVV